MCGKEKLLGDKQEKLPKANTCPHLKLTGIFLHSCRFLFFYTVYISQFGGHGVLKILVISNGLLQPVCQIVHIYTHVKSSTSSQPCIEWDHIPLGWSSSSWKYREGFFHSCFLVKVVFQGRECTTVSGGDGGPQGIFLLILSLGDSIGSFCISTIWITLCFTPELNAWPLYNYAMNWGWEYWFELV